MKWNNLSASLSCAAASALLAVSGSAIASAQQNITTAALHQPAFLSFGTAGDSSQPDLNLTENGIAYSSSTGADALASAESYDPGASSLDAAQPPPRRRYGRPNYSDKMHNSDGSNKIAIIVGGGLTLPTSSSTNYLKLSYKIQGGIGYNFNKKFGVIAQFDYDNFGLPASLITSQYNVYTAQGFTYSDGSTVSFAGLDGNTHDWSFTLNPNYNFYQGETMGAYAVVGAGFYHKVTNFTLPTTGTYCDYYYGCYSYQANQSFDEYTSNSGGVSGGVGLTYKFSRFASERFYVEARYVRNFNQAKAFSTTNLFPGNSATTSYIPITVGLRF